MRGLGMNSGELTALVVAAIGAVGAVVLQAWSMYLAYKRDESMTKKVEQNTALTKVGVEKVDTVVKKTDSAVVKIDQAATLAAQSVGAAKESIEKIHVKLNGGVDDSIEKAIRPLRAAFEEHMRVDEQNMRDIHAALQKLQEKVK